MSKKKKMAEDKVVKDAAAKTTERATTKEEESYKHFFYIEWDKELALETYCGIDILTMSTDDENLALPKPNRGEIDIQTDWEPVTCPKCLAKKPEWEIEQLYKEL